METLLFPQLSLNKISKYGSFIWYVNKIFRKNNISYPLIHTRVYQGVRNVSFSEYFAYVLNDPIPAAEVLTL